MAFQPLLLAAPGLGRSPEGRLVVLVWLPAAPRSSAVVFVSQWQQSVDVSPGDTLSAAGARALLTPQLCTVSSPSQGVSLWNPNSSRCLCQMMSAFTQVLNCFRWEPWRASSTASYLEAVFYHHAFVLFYELQLIHFCLRRNRSEFTVYIGYNVHIQFRLFHCCQECSGLCHLVHEHAVLKGMYFGVDVLGLGLCVSSHLSDNVRLPRFTLTGSVSAPPAPCHPASGGYSAETMVVVFWC